MSKPKISLNKLGEYLDAATPSRRRQIIKDQQQPKAFKAGRYTDAKKEIVDFLASEMLDDAKLLQAAQDLRNTISESDFIIQDKHLSADAIENFLDSADDLNIDGVTVEPVDRFDDSSMEVSGVEITIRPDAILRDEVTGEIAGAVKLHFSKTHPLSEKAAGYVAAALKVHLSENLENSNIKAEKCFVVDIPTQKVVTSTKKHISKMKDIKAACSEINAHWKEILDEQE